MKWGRHGRFDTEDAQARFKAKTKLLPTGCWQWTAAIGSHGRYGIVGVAGRHWLAHRAAWWLFRGEDPGERCVCHHCDNGLCVNPDHLFLGSQKDNVNDMESKQRSRHPSGAAHGRAKLTWDQIAVIRERRAAGATFNQLGREYGVAGPTIARIFNGKGWRK